MKNLLIIINVSLLIFCLFTSTDSRAELSGQSCDAGAMHKDRMSKLMLDKAPSLLEKCGIGGMFDLCGGFGGILGDIMDVICNGIDLDISSNFCGMEFSLDSIDGYYSYKDSPKKQNFDDNDESDTEAYAMVPKVTLSESLGLTEDLSLTVEKAAR